MSLFEDGGGGRGRGVLHERERAQRCVGGAPCFVTVAKRMACLHRCRSTVDAEQVEFGLRLAYPDVLDGRTGHHASRRSEEHTSELQSLMRISYAVFCLKKKKKHT